MTDNIPLAGAVELKITERVYEVDHLFSELYYRYIFTNVRERCINCCRECVKYSLYNTSITKHSRHLARCELCVFKDSDSAIIMITKIVIIDDKHICLKIENKYCDIICPINSSSTYVVLVDKLVIYNVIKKSKSKRENVMSFIIMNMNDRDIIELSFKYDKTIYELLLNNLNKCLIS